MKNLKLIFVLACSLSLFACASGGGSKSGPKLTCEPTNLMAIGKHDGQQGEPVDKAFEYQQKCAKKEKEMSLEDYKQGWSEGIKQYCAPTNAFALGKEKKEHTAKNCPIEMRTAFERNYNKGLKFNESKGELKDIEKEVSKQRDEIKSLEGKLREANKKLDQLQSKRVKIQNQIEAAKQDVY